MANETISQLTPATSVSGANDLLELSQYTGASGTGYSSKRVTVQQVANTFQNSIPVALEYVITNSGEVLINGVQPYVSVPFNATIISAKLFCTPTGSLTIDIWRCTYAQFDGGTTYPTVANTITGSNPLVISSDTKTTSTLTTWTTALYQGDVLAFYVTPTPASVISATVVLYLNRSI